MSRRRRSRSTRAVASAAATLAILACLGLAFGAGQLLGVDLGLATAPTATPAPRAEIAAPAAGDWYRLYFTDPAVSDDPGRRPERSIDDPVVADIDAALRTVDAATFEFDLPSMAEALIRAHQRGVVVRLVTDTDTLAEAVVQQVIAAGIPVVDDGRRGLMHHKFVIVDGATVWTGSWNFTQNDTYRNNNNLIGIAAPQLVLNYQTEFDEMFLRHEFGPAGSADTPYPQVAVEGALIENYFSPDDGVAAHIVAAIQGAAHSVYFAAFTFTRDDISQALIDRARAGVRVAGVYETRQVAAGSDGSYRALQEADLPVFLDGNRYTMHHKFIVVDNRTVITGSYNFTVSAEERNDENVLIIHDPAIAVAYLKEFAKVWQQSGGN